MYVIDVRAVDGDSGIEDRVSFLWEEGRLSREHEDGHVSSAGFSSSLGGALDKALFACCLVGLRVTEVTIHREETEAVLNG